MKHLNILKTRLIERDRDQSIDLFFSRFISDPIKIAILSDRPAIFSEKIHMLNIIINNSLCSLKLKYPEKKKRRFKRILTRFYPFLTHFYPFLTRFNELKRIKTK
jgi:hypothetical protein